MTTGAQKRGRDEGEGGGSWVGGCVGCLPVGGSGWEGVVGV